MLMLKIREFFREYKVAIRLILAVLLMISGLLVTALANVLLGLIMLFVGFAAFCYFVGALMRTGGYANREGQFSVGPGRTYRTTDHYVHGENDSGIWNQMTDKDNNAEISEHK